MDSFGLKQNPYDQHDAQDAAEQHYLRKADRERSRREEAPRRKQPQAPAPPLKPRQTPQVGKMSQGSLTAAQEASSRLAKSSSSRPHHTQTTRTTGSRTQLPQTTYSPFPSPKPLLARKPVSTERNDSPSSVLSFVSNAPTPKLAHGRSRPFDRETMNPYGAPPSSPIGSARTSSPYGSARPSSPNGSARAPSPNSLIFQRFSRRGSNASDAESQRPGSRRGSITQSLRRASNDFKKGIDIVKMDEEARTRWRVSEKARMEQEVEERRRRDPSSRPRYQQEYLDWKAKRVASPSSPEMDAHERTIALDTALRSKNGRGRLEAQQERDATAPLTAGEKLALLVSKAVDPLRKRQGRQNSDDSGMDFADCGAPIDIMESCKRCNRPVGLTNDGGLYLTDGYCPRCHRLRTQEFWDTDSPSDSGAGSIYSCSGKSTSPRREVDEEEYMKIVINKRIRRVRRTIYEDPGNPFMVFECEEDDIDVNDAPPAGFWGPGDVSPELSGASKHISTRDEDDSGLQGQELQSHPVVDARDSPMHAPTPQRIGTPALIKHHSIESALEAIISSHEEADGKPKRSASGRQRPAPRVQNAGTRDTAFYGFYDNVLQDYGQDPNRI